MSQRQPPGNKMIEIFEVNVFSNSGVFEERIMSNAWTSRVSKESKLVWNMLAWLATSAELSQPKEDQENKVGLQDL